MAKVQRKKNTAEASPAYSSPTVGLTKVFFAFGTTKDAASFLTMKRKLTRYVGTQSWPGSAVALRSIEDMNDPEFTKPERPKLEKGGQNRDINDPVIGIEFEDYSDNKPYRLQKEHWKENQRRVYNLYSSTAHPSWSPGSPPRQNGIRCR